jgi:hypothetical protein
MLRLNCAMQFVQGIEVALPLLSRDSSKYRVVAERKSMLGLSQLKMYLQYKLSVPPTSLINRKEYNAFIDAFHKRLFVGQHQVCIPEASRQQQRQACSITQRQINSVAICYSVL